MKKVFFGILMAIVSAAESVAVPSCTSSFLQPKHVCIADDKFLIPESVGCDKQCNGQQMMQCGPLCARYRAKGWISKKLKAGSWFPEECDDEESCLSYCNGSAACFECSGGRWRLIDNDPECKTPEPEPEPEPEPKPKPQPRVGGRQAVDDCDNCEAIDLGTPSVNTQYTDLFKRLLLKREWCGDPNVCADTYAYLCNEECIGDKRKGFVNNKETNASWAPAECSDSGVNHVPICQGIPVCYECTTDGWVPTGSINDCDDGDVRRNSVSPIVGGTGTGGCQYCCADSDRLRRVTAAMDILNNFIDNADVSVWKTADGKFNATRLASDFGAGVVLGTVGGLITNKVIKKKQVENNLDGYQCLVGGQVVAEYGDEFIIGMSAK